MSAITVDSKLVPQLQQVTEVTEVRDSGGALLGYFTPAGGRQAHLYAKALGMIDREEIKRRKEANAGHPGYSIEEVMKHLQSLEKEA